MTTLNKVISAQELNGRGIDHNLAMLLGVASEQGKSIRAVRDDIDLQFDVVDRQILEVKWETIEVKREIDEVRQDIRGVKQSMEARFDQVLQVLSTLVAKPDQEA